jgi:hypothetical protein
MPVIQNRNLWAGGSLIAVLLFTSGHMFNHIRQVPYVSGDGKGGIIYFAGGFQNQLGLETQIVAAVCMCSTAIARVSVLTTLQMVFWLLPPSRWPSRSHESRMRSRNKWLP